MPAKGQFKKGATADSIRQRKYNSQPSQIKRRAERNASRRKMEKAGKVRKGDGKMLTIVTIGQGITLLKTFL